MLEDFTNLHPPTTWPGAKQDTLTFPQLQEYLTKYQVYYISYLNVYILHKTIKYSPVLKNKIQVKISLLFVDPRL